MISPQIVIASFICFLSAAIAAPTAYAQEAIKGTVESVGIDDPLAALHSIDPELALAAENLTKALQNPQNGMQAKTMARLAELGVIEREIVEVPRPASHLAAAFVVSDQTGDWSGTFDSEAWVAWAMGGPSPAKAWTNYINDVLGQNTMPPLLDYSERTWNGITVPSDFRLVKEYVYVLRSKTHKVVFFAWPILSTNPARAYFNFYSSRVAAFKPGQEIATADLLKEVFGPHIDSSIAATAAGKQASADLILGMIPVVGGLRQIEQGDFAGGILSVLGDATTFGACSKYRAVKVMACTVNLGRIAHAGWQIRNGDGSVLAAADGALATVELVAIMIMVRKGYLDRVASMHTPHISSKVVSTSKVPVAEPKGASITNLTLDAKTRAQCAPPGTPEITNPKQSCPIKPAIGNVTKSVTLKDGTKATVKITRHQTIENIATVEITVDGDCSKRGTLEFMVDNKSPPDNVRIYLGETNMEAIGENNGANSAAFEFFHDNVGKKAKVVESNFEDVNKANFLGALAKMDGGDPETLAKAGIDAATYNSMSQAEKYRVALECCTAAGHLYKKYGYYNEVTVTDFIRIRSYPQGKPAN